jgi:hypothetical protein
MVPTNNLAGVELPADTLIVSSVPVAAGAGATMADEVIVLGALSSFPDLPGNSVALLAPALAQAEAAPVLGEFLLEGNPDLDAGKVIILAPDAVAAVKAAGSTDSSVVRPDLVGTLTGGATPEVVQVSSPTGTLPELAFNPANNTAMNCIDWIQCVCLMCGCCVEDLRDDLRYSSVYDDYILVPTNEIADSLITPDTWMATFGDGESPQITFAPRSTFAELPDYSLSLVPRSSVPPGVSPLGDVYMTGINADQALPSAYLVAPGADNGGDATIDPQQGVLSFSVPVNPNISTSTPPMTFNIDLNCPECDWGDSCRVDPVGCFCATFGCPFEVAEPTDP